MAAGASDVYESALRLGFLRVRAEGDLVGTLTVDTGSLPNGSYRLLVDYDHDGISQLSSGFDTEPLYGWATVTIVPEPASLALLALVLGMAGARCRR